MMYKQKLASCEATEDIFYASHETKEKNVRKTKMKSFGAPINLQKKNAPLTQLKRAVARTQLAQNRIATRSEGVRTRSGRLSIPSDRLNL